MAFGFGLLGSPQGKNNNNKNNNNTNGLYEFTPIGKKRSNGETSFQVLHSYPPESNQQQQFTNRRKLFQPLKESNILYNQSPSGLFDETIDDFENSSPSKTPQQFKATKATNTTNLKERYEFNGQENGFAAKQSEETIKELRGENYGWKIKYKELLRSLENMPLSEKEIRVENISLKETLALLNQEIQQLRNENNKLNTEREIPVDQDPNEVHQLKQKINELNNTLLEDDELIRALKQERDGFANELHEIQDFIKHSEVEFDKVVQQEKLNREEIKSLRKTIENLRDGQRNDKASNQIIDSLNEELRNLKEGERGSTKEIRNLEEKISEQAHLIQNLQSTIAEKSKSVNQLESKLETQKSQLHHNSSEERDYNRKVQRLQEELDHKQREIDQFEELIEQLKYENQMLSNNLKVAKDKLSKASGDDLTTRQLQDLNDELNEQLMMEKSQIQRLKNRLKESGQSNDQINFYEAEFEKVKKELDAKSEELQKVKSKLQAVDKDSHSYKNKFVGLQSLIDEKEFTIQNISIKLSQLEKENARLKDKVNKLQSSSDNYNSIHQDNLELEHELSSSKREIDNLMNQIRNLKLHRSHRDDRSDDIERLKEKEAILTDENRWLRQKLDESMVNFNYEELHQDNIELSDRLRKSEFAQALLEEGLSKLEAENNELIETLKYQEHQIESKVNQQILDLKSKLRACDEYIDKLESDLRLENTNHRQLNDLEFQLKQSKELIASHEIKYKALQDELNKRIEKSSNTSEEFLKFQLKSVKGDLESITNKLKSTEERFKSQLNELEENKQITENQLMVVKSKNRDLEKELSFSEQRERKWLNNCKTIGIKYSNLKNLTDKSASPEYIQFLIKESYYFRQRYQDCTLAKRNLIFMYNFVLDRIRNTNIGLDNNNLVITGIYPPPNSKTKLTFKALAKFVLASVILKNRGKQHGKRSEALDSVRTDLKVAKIQFK
ncbi:unnamed protein product [Candida verbasci]|uniref:Guanylate kinase-like domain-containing protein n=1 Tax=Candida verbasci TaxID=1227364 RepID=A0A9W4XB89_9ASCO|nr:unnamed protein product [Candida verbasci]